MVESTLGTNSHVKQLVNLIFQKVICRLRGQFDVDFAGSYCAADYLFRIKRFDGNEKPANYSKWNSSN